MSHRFHRPSNASGKWEHVPHVGIRQVAREKVGDWQIEVSHRQVGSAIKRDQYSVILRCEAAGYEESLTGFASKLSAISAARKRVDLLRHVRRPVASNSRLSRTSHQATK